MRFLSTIFFGEGDQWFISPLGDAHFRNLTASQITASSVTTDYLTVTRSETIAGLNADFLDGKDGGYYLSWNNFTEKPVILSSLEGVSNNEGNIDLVASGNIVITPNDTNNTITFNVPATAQGSGSGLNADLLDSLDSFQFLRSDTSDSFAFGTLTFASGTTLSVAGSLSLPTGSITSDFILNGTIVGADLAGDISIFTSGNLATTGSGTIASAGLLSAENGFTLSAGSLSLPAASVADSFLTSNVMLLNAAQTSTATKTFSPASSAGVPLIIKGLASQTGDLLQLKDSLDAVLARVDALGNIVSAGTLTGTQLVSTVATGTAPLTVASTTVVPNLNAASAQQPNPNLVLNSDFGRRNKWMTFMPETFTDTSGWTQLVGANGVGSVASNLLTAPAGDGRWAVRAGLSTWRDIRMSAQVKVVSTTEAFAVGRMNTAEDDYLLAFITNGSFQIAKKIGGVPTTVATVVQTTTLNNFYWIEIEFQGSTVIAKMYSSGASAAAKSSATLLQTLTGTVSDSVVASGQMTLFATTASSIWGGLATGDGGVYVEGFGPESWGAYSTLFSEIFTDTSGWTAVDGTLGTVASNILTAGTAGAVWRVRGSMVKIRYGPRTGCTHG